MDKCNSRRDGPDTAGRERGATLSQDISSLGYATSTDHIGTQTERDGGLGTSVHVVLLNVLIRFEMQVAVHSLHVTSDVHLLLGAVDAVGALELRLLATLPLLVVAQRRLELVQAAAVRTREPGVRGPQPRHPRHPGHQRQRQARRPLLPRQAPDAAERHVLSAARRP